MLPLLGLLMPLAEKVFDRVLPDTEARDAAKRELTMELMRNAKDLEEAAASIIRSEAKSEHTITATWRPILMLVITAIIANNFILAPYLAAFTGTSIVLPLPDELWNLLTVGVGGYIVSRGAEKVTKTWRGGDG